MCAVAVLAASELDSPAVRVRFLSVACAYSCVFFKFGCCRESSTFVSVASQQELVLQATCSPGTSHQTEVTSIEVVLSTLTRHCIAKDLSHISCHVAEYMHGSALVRAPVSPYGRPIGLVVLTTELHQRPT